MKKTDFSVNTSDQYNSIIKICRDIFQAKLKDYGSAWRLFRPASLTDQIYIKAKRIRSIEDKGKSMIDEGIFPEFAGIANYAVMALIQLELGPAEETNMGAERALDFYNRHFHAARNLMDGKNHDYDEAWREMRISSLTDLILVKLLRIKQIEGNDGKTTVSEGVEANFLDIINYAVFAMIRLEELKNRNEKGN